MEPRTHPAVSVVVLSFNTGGYVIEALECLAAQSIPDFEVIVVDDCSTDSSAELIRSWSERTGFSLRLFVNTENRGIAASLNRGISAAVGDYVTWLSDDLWEADRLEQVVTAFGRLPSTVQVVFGDAIVIDAAGSETGLLALASTLIAIGFAGLAELADLPCEGIAVIPGEAIRRALFWRCVIPAPTATVRRSLYEVIGPYDESLAIEDLDCWFRASEVTDFGYLHRPLVKYRRHATNFSSGRSRSYLAALDATLDRYLPNDRDTRRAARRHVREEAFRVATGLAEAGNRRMASLTARDFYVPNVEFSRRCLKESLLLAKRLVLRPSGSSPADS